jgi:hypothetical protein
MDFDYNDDQSALVDAVSAILNRHAELRKGPTITPMSFSYSDSLDSDLLANGFYDIVREEGLGALEAAMMIAEIALSPHTLEVVATALVAPSLLPGETLPRPIAIARTEDLTRAVRFLDRAQTVLVDDGERVVVLAVEPGEVEELQARYAYPLGRFRTAPDLSRGRALGGALLDEFRRLWRVGVTLEIAGAARAAIGFTTDYVKDRQVFGRPIGSFQAVQHRLAADVPLAEGAYWAGLQAAWSGLPVDAASALLHAQGAVSQIIYDTHQFNGALGFTLEHPLHFWTQRLRWLAAEIGGVNGQADLVADLVWPDP